MDSFTTVVIIPGTEGDSILLVQRSDLSWALQCILYSLLQQEGGHGPGQCLPRSHILKHTHTWLPSYCMSAVPAHIDTYRGGYTADTVADSYDTSSQQSACAVLCG